MGTALFCSEPALNLCCDRFLYLPFISCILSILRDTKLFGFLTCCTRCDILYVAHVALTDTFLKHESAWAISHQPVMQVETERIELSGMLGISGRSSVSSVPDPIADVILPRNMCLMSGLLMPSGPFEGRNQWQLTVGFPPSHTWISCESAESSHLASVSVGHN